MDTTAFQTRDYSPQQFVELHLSNATHDEITSFYSSLSEAKAQATSNIQRSVLKNYPLFVNISKEISTLESDLLSLKEQFSELKSNLDNILEGYESVLQRSPAVSESPKKLNRRSTIMSVLEPFEAQITTVEEKVQSLDKFRMAQMRRLYELVDGLQRALPEDPKRQVVMETPSFVELHPVTYKPRGGVHIFLLSDVCIIATKKRLVKSFKQRLKLEQLFILENCSFMDIKDSSELSNAFRISRPDQGGCLLRTENVVEKRKLVSLLKAFFDERNTKLEGLTGLEEVAKELSQTQLSNDSKSVQSSTSSIKNKKETFSNTEIKWLIESMDELDVWIALRNFQDAVNRIKQAKELFEIRQSDVSSIRLRRQLDEKVKELSSVMIHDLANQMITKAVIQERVALLAELGLAHQVVDVFLKTRSDMLHARIRKLLFEGDIVQYISELSLLVFTTIRHTSSWFLCSFNNLELSSALVKWAKEEISFYINIFRRQVFNNHHKFSVVADCLKVSTQYCKMLSGIGMDFGYLLEDNFSKDIRETVHACCKRSLLIIKKSIEEDQLGFTDHGIVDEEFPGNLHLTTSGVVLVDLLQEFMSGWDTLLRFMNGEDAIVCFSSMFKNFVESSYQRCMNGKTSFKMSLCVATNISYVINHLLPKTFVQLKEKYSVEMKFIASQQSELKKIEDKLLNASSLISGKNLINSHYRFEEMALTTETQIGDDAVPSDNMLEMIFHLKSISNHLSTCHLPNLEEKEVLGSIVQSGMQELLLQRHWEIKGQPKPFGLRGIQQFLLDIHFFLKVCSKLVTETSRDMANQCCEKALRCFMATHATQTSQLKGTDFYDKRVEEAMKYLGFDSFDSISGGA